MKFITILAIFIFPLFGILLNLNADELKFSGGTTVQPIIEKLSQKYLSQKNVSINTIGGGSEIGVLHLKNSQTDFAMVRRDLSEKEKKEFAYFTLGYDSVAFIVNKSKKLTNISKNDIIRIYKGEIINWNEFGEEDSKIIPISRQIDRATLGDFENFSGLISSSRRKMANNIIRIDAWEAGANMDVIFWVAGLTEAMGYVSLGDAKRYESLLFPIKILKVDDVEPNAKNIHNKTYPILTSLNILYNPNNQKAQDFIEWLRKDDNLNVVSELGFIKVADELH